MGVWPLPHLGWLLAQTDECFSLAPYHLWGAVCTLGLGHPVPFPPCKRLGPMRLGFYDVLEGGFSCIRGFPVLGCLLLWGDDVFPGALPWLLVAPLHGGRQILDDFDVGQPNPLWVVLSAGRRCCPAVGRQGVEAFLHSLARKVSTPWTDVLLCCMRKAPGGGVVAISSSSPVEGFLGGRAWFY